MADIYTGTEEGIKTYKKHYTKYLYFYHSIHQSTPHKVITMLCLEGHSQGQTDLYEKDR